MKINKLPLYYKDNSYIFNRFLGLLLVKKQSEKMAEKNKINKKVLEYYKGITNPYELRCAQEIITHDIVLSSTAQIYARIMVFLCKHSFALARVFSYFPIVQYDNTTLAIDVFSKIFPGGYNQRTLCLPRTLFALATSRTFKKNGVAFIGVFLPSRKMHAWIIENNINPDPYDNAWICYQPVATITK